MTGRKDLRIEENKGKKEEEYKGREKKCIDLRKKRMKELKKHLSQFGVVDEVRSVSVDEGTQGQAILPTEQHRAEKKAEGGSEGIRNTDRNVKKA